jgi:hypothetical protein
MENYQLNLIKEVEKEGKKAKVYEVVYKDNDYPRKIGKLKVAKTYRTFLKEVDSTKHKMRLFNAYGIQKDFFDKYLKGKKGKIFIYEIDLNRYLESDIKDWEEHGKYANYGSGRQMFLSLNYFKSFKAII